MSPTASVPSSTSLPADPAPPQNTEETQVTEETQERNPKINLLDRLALLHEDLRQKWKQEQADLNSQRKGIKRFISYLLWNWVGVMTWALWPLVALMMAIKLGLHTSFVFGTLIRLFIDFYLFALVRIASYLFEYKSKLRFYGVTSFQEWAAVAAQLDVSEGKDVWRKEDESPLYDSVGLKQSLAQIQKALEDENCHELEFSLTGVFDRHYCGIDNPGLHTHCRLGTKQIIEQYLTKVEEALTFFCEHTCSVHSVQEKHAFLEKAMSVQGKTALCLSGGGALAMIHTGLLLTLLQHDLLPSVLSGTSGGSLVVAMIATRTDQELLEILNPDIVNKHKPFFPSLLSQLVNFLKYGVAVQEREFCENMKSYIGSYTFLEAYELTGRVVNISVTKSNASGYPILLNYKNSPDVMLWSAVTASCALPGLLNPVHLYAKPRYSRTEVTGFTLAFPSEFKFMDGSMMADLPMGALRRQFGVNQFIISQVNPHVAPFVRRKDGTTTLLERIELNLVKNLKHRISRLCDMNLLPNMFGQDIRGVFLQQYSDTTNDTTTIIPDFSPFISMKCLSQPTREDMIAYMYLGHSATWAKLPQIYHRMRLEKAIERHFKKITKHKTRDILARGDSPSCSLRRVNTF